jgi:peptidoglycan/LPS O-acetylase OafA/YrhL
LLSSSSHSTHERSRPAIDGLRAIAILAVFVFHLNRQWLPGGFVGVDVFFVISGYLITSILLKQCADGSFNLAKFYQRRVARLFPAFFTVALATLAAASLVYSAQDLASCGANFAAAALSVANLKYMLQGSYFVVSPDAQPFLHYWSLSVEEQFYLVFPVVLLFLFMKAGRRIGAILSVLCAISLIACVLLTPTRPALAFYLLPTRAWELLAGSVLANAGRRSTFGNKNVWASLAWVGLAFIAISFFTIKESSAFPGYLAVLPVAGTVLLLGREGAERGLVETLLSWKPLVTIGRMSYSLYLWHWPVFSMVDYKLYLASPLVRIGLKLGITAAATALCFFLIENPGRVFFNRRDKRVMSFALLSAAIISSVAVGIAVRRFNYIDAGGENLAKEAIVFNRASKMGSVLLMGDSNGSMYGKTVKDVANKLGAKLVIISVAAGDPLPYSSRPQPQLWLDSFNTVKRGNPTTLIVVCDWQARLQEDKARLAIAIKLLKPYVGQLILITQPPKLPSAATREAIRNGSRPPFSEDHAERAARIQANALVKSFRGAGITVIDIESLFADQDGRIYPADGKGHEFFQDANHLSGFGADAVKPYILQAISQPVSRSTAAISGQTHQ